MDKDKLQKLMAGVCPQCGGNLSATTDGMLYCQKDDILYKMPKVESVDVTEEQEQEEMPEPKDLIVRAINKLKKPRQSRQSQQIQQPLEQDTVQQQMNTEPQLTADKSKVWFQGKKTNQITFTEEDLRVVLKLLEQASKSIDDEYFRVKTRIYFQLIK